MPQIYKKTIADIATDAYIENILIVSGVVLADLLICIIYCLGLVAGVGHDPTTSGL